MQLYLDYRRDVHAIDIRIAEIFNGYRQSLGEGLWRLDANQLQLQIDGIRRLPDVSYVELREATDRGVPLIITAGLHAAGSPVRNEFKIHYSIRGTERWVGTLIIEARFDQIYRQLLGTAGVIMAGQAIKTFLTSFFILFIVHQLITRHLGAIARSLKEYDFQDAHTTLQLKRHPPQSADELDYLVGAFNQMYERLRVVYNDLKEREAKVRRLFESNIIGILIGHPDGHIDEANEAFLKIVGYDQADLAAGRLRRRELTPPEWHDRDTRAVADMRRNGTVQPFEKEYFRKDGSRVPVLVGGATLDERGDAVVVFALDLTERKRAEAELAHANRVSTMGQLTASIGHEVNQPIAALIINAETTIRWLDREQPSLEKVRPLIDRVISDGKRAANIINRIRNFSRKAPAQIADTDVNEAILEITILAQAAMSDNEVVATMQLSESLPHIFADKIQLQQVILNLIMNAIEAMSEMMEIPRELAITTRCAEEGGILISVSDTGPGLPEDNSERIFDAFYTTKSKGMGMGLSICRSIVEAHGGRFWAMPNKPRGAVFSILLPIKGRSRKLSAAVQT
ncbi:sensor histidine kinase [Bradyrhizobium canariense]|uniref:sensor histidine kinase n=1 Tax=Bradyrhizobium canariense TaxID=255045 RepID=UPI0013022F76|nr:ATP-binding protein [Bradyrhizobium canariense]